MKTTSIFTTLICISSIAINVPGMLEGRILAIVVGLFSAAGAGFCLALGVAASR